MISTEPQFNKILETNKAWTVSIFETKDGIKLVTTRPGTEPINISSNLFARLTSKGIIEKRTIYTIAYKPNNSLKEKGGHKTS